MGGSSSFVCWVNCFHLLSLSQMIQHDCIVIFSLVHYGEYLLQCLRDISETRSTLFMLWLGTISIDFFLLSNMEYKTFIYYLWQLRQDIKIFSMRTKKLTDPNAFLMFIQGYSSLRIFWVVISVQFWKCRRDNNSKFSLILKAIQLTDTSGLTWSDVILKIYIETLSNIFFQYYALFWVTF